MVNRFDILRLLVQPKIFVPENLLNVHFSLSPAFRFVILLKYMVLQAMEHYNTVTSEWVLILDKMSSTFVVNVLSLYLFFGNSLVFVCQPIYK